MYNFFMCCWFMFASILLKIFESIFIEDTSVWFSFCVVSLSSFGNSNIGLCFKI